MLSYQHIYHAGNFVDVQKHAVLTALLKRIRGKNRPMVVIDTHAGRGVYDLTSKEAKKNHEYEYGIERFWPDRKEKTPLADYMQLVARLNKNGVLQSYPGSAKIAHYLVGEKGKLLLAEKHPKEFAALKAGFENYTNVTLSSGDGFKLLDESLPVAGARAVVLVDPSYEVKSEYNDVADYVNDAVEKDSEACFFVWYPILKAGNHVAMLENFRKHCESKTLVGEIVLECPLSESFRLLGSGLIIINPPGKFEESFEKINKFIAKRLSVKAGYKVFQL